MLSCSVPQTVTSTVQRNTVCHKNATLHYVPLEHWSLENNTTTTVQHQFSPIRSPPLHSLHHANYCLLQQHRSQLSRAYIAYTTQVTAYPLRNSGDGNISGAIEEATEPRAQTVHIIMTITGPPTLIVTGPPQQGVQQQG